jgi:alkanesulfonate monooxygenase SsuD/methylene tetrahydromethanopterin reductase-like flavin-dependent oxidoreductase (luciferase family)
MDVGLISLGDRMRHRMLVEAGTLADQCGFTSFNIGDYNGSPRTTSSPAVVLAAVAERTHRIRLGAAVALANVDALRLAEDYATLDALSGGRVELVVGRGKTFDAHASFEENLGLLLQLWRGGPVHWVGNVRPPINGEALQPPPIQTDRAPVWVGAGGSPETAVLPARLGLKLMLPSALDAPSGLREVVDRYLDSYVPAAADDDAQIGGCWHVSVAAMGSPAEIVDRLCALAELLTLDTQLLKIDMRGPENECLAMIELFGTDVLPLLPRSS